MMAMNENPQKKLYLSISNDKDVLEFIQHQDHHFWIYYNGQATDVIYPRHEELDKTAKRYKIFKRLVFGKSVYNQNRITNFFRELVPEEFL